MDTNTLDYLILFNGFPNLFQKNFQSITRPGKDQTIRPIRPIWVSSSDVWFEITETQKQSNTKFQFPYVFFKLQNIRILEETTNSYPSRTLHRLGLIGKLNDSNNTYTVHRPIPADFDVEVTFITEDFKEILRFANKWAFVAVKKLLNFNLKYDDRINFSIRTELQTSIQLPEKENQVENINYYELKATLTIFGYMSEDIPYEELEKRTKITSIAVRPVIYSQQFPDLDAQIASDVSGATSPNYIPIPGTDGIEEYLFTDDENNKITPTPGT